MSNKTGIVLLSHGSRLDYGRQVIEELADMYRKTTDYEVTVAFMEICEPNIPQSINKLIEDKPDIERLVVVPVFLADGIHTKRDIPKILGIASDEEDESHHSHGHGHHHGDEHGHHHHHHHELETVNFDGEIIYTSPLGADPRIVDIISDRVNNSL